MVTDHRLGVFRTPVLVEDLGLIDGGDEGHDSVAGGLWGLAVSQACERKRDRQTKRADSGLNSSTRRRGSIGELHRSFSTRIADLTEPAYLAFSHRLGLW